MRFHLYDYVTLLMLLSVSGCGYPVVSSKTYELSKAMYSACNQKSDEHLAKVDALIQLSLDSNEITEREAGWLKKISQQAHSGGWEAAMLESRELMDAQVQ